MAEQKKAYIKTYGCQMNVYDSQRIADTLMADGYALTDAPESADLTVLNTCHIREKAAEKVYSDLGRLRKVQDRRGPDDAPMQIAVAGCVAQAEGDEMLRRARNVDIVVGPQAYQDLPQLLKNRKAGRQVAQDFKPSDKFAALKAAPRARKSLPTAFLTIQEGCDKFCTFCVVPYTRGAEFSRPVADIVEEAKALVAGGARDITLLGQNVNAYHGEGTTGASAGLAELLYQLARIDGAERLRYTTSHPRDMSPELIAAHGEIPALMPYLHLPVQSGSDAVLQRMNRKHDRARYFDVIEQLRDARPDLALSSDLIVGFPGESEKDFEDTMDLVRQVTFAQCYSFKYSPRAGTPGAEMDDQVREDVKGERLARLQALLNEQQLAFNDACLGKTMPVLFERAGKSEGQMIGRSPYMQSVHVEFGTQEAANAAMGQLIDCEILQSGPNSLKAKLCSAIKA